MDDALKKLIIDCDGVIAGKDNGGEYAKAPPLQHGIDQVNKLYDMGYVIVLFTARYGERRHGDIHKMYGAGYIEWVEWLDKHGVKYHYAYMGKPAGVMYIDDKAARVEGDTEEGWTQVWKEIDNLKGRDKYGNIMCG